MTAFPLSPFPLPLIPSREPHVPLSPYLDRTYAVAPLAPQAWGEQTLTPPTLGGLGGQNYQRKLSGFDTLRAECGLNPNCAQIF